MIGGQFSSRILDGSMLTLGSWVLVVKFGGFQVRGLEGSTSIFVIPYPGK